MLIGPRRCPLFSWSICPGPLSIHMDILTADSPPLPLCMCVLVCLRAERVCCFERGSRRLRRGCTSCASLPLFGHLVHCFRGPCVRIHGWCLETGASSGPGAGVIWSLGYDSYASARDSRAALLLSAGLRHPPLQPPGCEASFRPRPGSCFDLHLYSSFASRLQVVLGSTPCGRR